MTILGAFRGRFSTASPAESGSTSSPAAGDADVLPFAGYDRLDRREVLDNLHSHSQVELEAVESYERSHQQREPVLDKLRFMRQSEPLAGYDALSVDDIVAAIEDADLPKIKKVRGYERKFANRPGLLDEVDRVRRRRLEAERGSESASPMPAYQPMSASAEAAASRRGDRADRPAPE